MSFKIWNTSDPSRRYSSSYTNPCKEIYSTVGSSWGLARDSNTETYTSQQGEMILENTKLKKEIKELKMFIEKHFKQMAKEME